MARKSCLKCDAYCLKSEDFSYICTTCDFWIHKRCALSPFIIPNPTCHHHPLNLVYSIPDMHRYFRLNCCICSDRVYKNSWMYYCHRCTCFVHIKCANSPPRRSIACDELKVDVIDNEHDSVHFPLYNEESMFDLIVSQFSKIQVEFQDEGKNIMTTTTKENDPHIIEEHWSHYENHPLEQLQFTAGENDNDSNDNNDIKVLVCDGCIQPIIVSHPSYYACIPCGYFLHSFRATKLPLELPVGGSTVHPEHPLFLHFDRFYKFVRCGACKYSTNGFYYECETCDIILNIRCAFLPTRIKHISHKHHSLVQSEDYGTASNSEDELVDDENDKLVYECHTCMDIDNFKINISCSFYPSRLKHKYDLHDITLRHPPFFYEGAFYCEICEEQVNNQLRLYHCDECDHSFHDKCLIWKESVKLGGTIKLIINNEPHTLALILKRASTRKNSTPYICQNCKDESKWNYFFDCDGCGYFICCNCVIKIMGEDDDEDDDEEE